MSPRATSTPTSTTESCYAYEAWSGRVTAVDTATQSTPAGNTRPPRASNTTYAGSGHTELVDDVTTANNDAAYGYDPAGTLHTRHKPGATDQTRLYFRWAGSATLAEETDGTGTTKTRYLRGHNGSILGQETGTTFTWLLADLSANTATHINDTGAVIEQAAFDPNGRPQTAGNSKAAGAPSASLGFSRRPV